jgi:hypothetical protein
MTTHHKSDSGKVRLQLGAAGEEMLFKAQSRYADVIGVAPPRSVILRRALQCFAQHLDTLDKLSPEDLQIEELTLLRLERSN